MADIHCTYCGGHHSAQFICWQMFDAHTPSVHVPNERTTDNTAPAPAAPDRSETPWTDANEVRDYDGKPYGYVEADFARDLERLCHQQQEAL